MTHRPPRAWNKGGLTHGECRTRTWRTWATLITMLTSKDPHRMFKPARTIDPRWRDFSNFLAGMGEQPEDHKLALLPSATHYNEFNAYWKPLSERERLSRAVRQSNRPMTKPSHIHPDGTRKWYVEGQLHRLDGPAVISPNGTRKWYAKGQLHRLDGPAVTRSDGAQQWWVEGKLHRLDGPAVTRSDGKQAWWVEGQLHRLDGPAVTRSDGAQEWYAHGKRFPDELHMRVHLATPSKR